MPNYNPITSHQKLEPLPIHNQATLDDFIYLHNNDQSPFRFNEAEMQQIINYQRYNGNGSPFVMTN